MHLEAETSRRLFITFPLLFFFSFYFPAEAILLNVCHPPALASQRLLEMAQWCVGQGCSCAVADATNSNLRLPRPDPGTPLEQNPLLRAGKDRPGPVGDARHPCSIVQVVHPCASMPQSPSLPPGWRNTSPRLVHPQLLQKRLTRSVSKKEESEMRGTTC